MRIKSIALSLFIAHLYALPHSAAAQSTPENNENLAEENTSVVIKPASDDVVRQASDAFGVRIGTESFGLYNEFFARGFNLQAAGNYRLDGIFYVPAATPSVSTVDSSTVRVGLAALPFDFPSPSGVVDYALRGPAAAPFLELRAGIEEYQSSHLATDFSMGSEALGMAGGIELNPNSNYNDGTEGDLYSFGVVPQWQLSERTQLRGLLGATRWRYNGDTAYVPQALILPPNLAPRERLGPDNAEFEQQDFNLGLLLRHEFNFAELRAGVFKSARSVPIADFSVIGNLDAQGLGLGALYTSPDQHAETLSGEISLTRPFEMGAWTHRITASLRARQSESLSHEGTANEFGLVRLGGPDAGRIAIDRARGQASVDEVTQNSTGLSWRAAWTNQLELRAGLLRTDNEKEVVRTSLADQAARQTLELSTRNAAISWLPNASVTWQANPQLALYTSYVRGLEESGVAPNIASNRNAILPAVLARQIDLGLRWQPADSHTLTAALFEIEKATPALDDDRLYALSGQARYRGLEASWNARLDNGLSWVLGAVALDLDRQAMNEPVRTAVGIPERQALFGISYVPTAFPEWTIDSQIRTQNARFADTRNLLQTPGFTTVNLGLRYRYHVDGSNLRLQWLNASDVREWVAQSSQTLGIVSPQTVRLVVTHKF